MISPLLEFALIKYSQALCKYAEQCKDTFVILIEESLDI